MREKLKITCKVSLVTTTGVVKVKTPVNLPGLCTLAGGSDRLFSDRSRAVLVMNPLIVPALTGTLRKPESQSVPDSPVSKICQVTDAS